MVEANHQYDQRSEDEHSLASGHAGYIMVTTDEEIEFVVEVRLASAATDSYGEGTDSVYDSHIANNMQQSSSGTARRDHHRNSWPPQPHSDVSSSAPDLKHQSHRTNQSSTTSRGVYFRRQSLDFGRVSIGSLSRLKLELCNATDDEVGWTDVARNPVYN